MHVADRRTDLEPIRRRPAPPSRPRRLAGAGALAALVAAAGGLAGCLGEVPNAPAPVTMDVQEEAAAAAESCMSCHNGSSLNDYGGGGLENPHPFSGAANLACTTCHGGDGEAGSKSDAHVPPPPEIGDAQNLVNDPAAYFNRRTLAGIDKFPDYTAGGRTYSALDYLQFINPGDLRVVQEFRSCGQCHGPKALSSPASKHAEWAARSPLGTETGIFSGAIYALGIDNRLPQNQGRYEDTAGDLAFRAVVDQAHQAGSARLGTVGTLVEFPVVSVFGRTGGANLFQNPQYDSADLPNDLEADNSVKPGSPLANLFHEQVAFTCGDCHLGSAGANNRYGDFRSSGCTACHMRYSLDGRSRSGDPRVKKNEPADPDAIAAPERAHVRRHLIRTVAKTLPGGEFVTGIDDYTCAGCHQGSNRTVMQYWGIRLDQNADLAAGLQYPANPASFQNTANDARLFDPVVGNQTFNGRNADQYILFEDYDGDGRDDTPPDVHYEAGLGCIDCHGGRDLHGGVNGDATSGAIVSRQEQVVAISCESCHGTIETYAQTEPCLTYEGAAAQCAVDGKGNSLRHVTRESGGAYYLVSRLTGQRHYVPQTRDTVDATAGVVHPVTSQPVYSAKAAYAMGRADGDPATGIGPRQTDGTMVGPGFSHGDEMSCTSCHASWTNGCIGCHLGGAYDDDPDNFFFSNITGERIVFKQANADFTYQSPVPFQLGVDTHNRISPISPNTTAFFRYTDLNGVESRVFAFTDRNGNGNNPNTAGRGPFPALSHNVMMPHSIRGKVAAGNEGPRYCVACHLTQEALANYGAGYDQFRTALQTGNFGNLDFDLLKQHIGENPGNQLNSPFWVHMASGLGSGLFLFDQDGCPVNPLDQNPNRHYCKNGAPANNFNVNDVVYDLDRIVEESGVANSSNNHPMLRPGQGVNKRVGARNPNLAGPLGTTLLRRLTDPNTGIVLDSWIDADGRLQGDAGNFVP